MFNWIFGKPCTQLVERAVPTRWCPNRLIECVSFQKRIDRRNKKNYLYINGNDETNWINSSHYRLASRYFIDERPMRTHMHSRISLWFETKKKEIFFIFPKTKIELTCEKKRLKKVECVVSISEFSCTKRTSSSLLLISRIKPIELHQWEPWVELNYESDWNQMFQIKMLSLSGSFESINVLNMLLKLLFII